MRLLLFVNLIAIVVIAGALGRMYEGTPLPWKISLPERTASSGEETSPQTPSVDMPATPIPNPIRVAPQMPKPEQHPAGETLRVLTEGAYPPFNFRNGDGKLIGFDVDMAEALCADLAVECSIETRAWKDLLPALKRGEGDVVVASMLIPSRGHPGAGGDTDIAFSQAYYTTPGHFAARRDARIAGASAEALAGRRIVVQTGTTHEAFLKARFPDSIVIDVSSLAAAEEALASGRAELLFADRNALLSWTMGGKGAGCCLLVGVDYSDPMYFGEGAGIALRAGDEALLARVNKALGKIKADGTQRQIALRYFGQSIR
jgi:polar amino acid transport system substrate-binding protein